MLVAVAAAAVIAVWLLATPKAGKVLVVATGPRGKLLDKVTIAVDGTIECLASPCKLELSKGAHTIRASAPGHAAQEQAIPIRAGDEAALNFSLEKASIGTGVRVSGTQEGIELLVDGKLIGSLPLEVRDLAPGTHKVVVKGSERYAPEERTVTLAQDQMLDLGDVALPVVRGLATFQLRTPGAKVVLVSGAERRRLTDFSQPFEIETAKTWTLEATKPGYEDLRLPLRFDESAAKTFPIELREKAEMAGVAAAGPTETRASAAVAKAASSVEEQPLPPPPNLDDGAEQPVATKPGGGAGSGETCILNLNSIPVSSVVMDGRPLGGTPRVGVSAAAGSHSVVFVHPDLGREAASVSCKPGESKTVAVRFANR